MEDFIRHFADALMKPVESINATDNFRKYKEWDSMAALDLLSLIKMQYGLIIPVSEFVKLTTVEQVYHYIRESNQS